MLSVSSVVKKKRPLPLASLWLRRRWSTNRNADVSGFARGEHFRACAPVADVAAGADFPLAWWNRGTSQAVGDIDKARYRIRTGVRDFAGPCLASRPTRHGTTTGQSGSARAGGIRSIHSPLGGSSSDKTAWTSPWVIAILIIFFVNSGNAGIMLIALVRFGSGRAILNETRHGRSSLTRTTSRPHRPSSHR